MKGIPTGFWGKLESGPDGTIVGWHPLAHHCLDVAAVCKCLLEVTVLGNRLATLAGWDELSAVHIARLSVLAGFHDVGKYNIGFQNKCLPTPAFTCGHVSEVSALFNDGGPDTGRFAEALGFPLLEAWGEEQATAFLLLASICHHGRPVPPASTGVVPDPRRWRPASNLNPWDGLAGLRTELFARLPEAMASGAPFRENTAEFQHAFSGLITLADWIASDTGLFPFSDELESPRFEQAVSTAQAAFRRMGIDPAPGRSGLQRTGVGFHCVSEYEPRSVQRLVSSTECGGAGSLVTLEADTGAGKTEAALVHFLRLFDGGLVDGMYFALPTRTSATQIHRRVVQAMQRAFPNEGERPPVVLAVPGYLRVDDRSAQRLAPFEVLWDDDKSSRFRHRGWAAEHPKRYLAGAVVVGTIDQVLLSTVMVAHAHLRATALLRHLLVVDEVHASDAYMLGLLEEVLHHHLRAGGHALLMSATLGAYARQRLLNTGRKELSRQSGLDEAVSTPYPLVVVRQGAEPPEHRNVIDDSGRERSVRMDLQDAASQPDQVAESALEAASVGARVIVLRNTVRDCLETQSALEEEAGRSGREALLFHCHNRCAPHHSRFARDDRMALDNALEAAFKTRAPDVGAVIVATQTIQQSLDLDADLMFTDLCPADVLIQRIGRVHRHHRTRPRGFAQPVVKVLVPETRSLAELLRPDGSARGPHGLGSVYEDLCILEATWRLIERCPIWELPSGSRWLVENSVHPEILEALAEELGGPWRRHRQHVLGSVLAHRRHATRVLIDRGLPFAHDGAGFPSRELGGRIKTRLGTGDIVVTFPQTPEGPFGNRVALLSIPATLAQGAEPDSSVSVTIDGDGEFRFGLAEDLFTYGRLGLRRIEDE